MKFILAAALFTISMHSFAQDGPKAARRYTSFVGGSFMRSDYHIENAERNLLQEYKFPGFYAGIDRVRIGQKGFTYLIGIHYQFLPLSYRYTVDKDEFDNTSTQMFNNFVAKAKDLGVGQLYVPILFGYTLQNKAGNWEPEITGGIHANFLTSFQIGITNGFIDNNDNYNPVFAIRVFSPNSEAKLWLTYAFKIRTSKNFTNGNKIHFGLNANISGKDVFTGDYAFFLKDEVQRGTYRDSQSYLGAELGYSILRRKK